MVGNSELEEFLNILIDVYNIPWNYVDSIYDNLASETDISFKCHALIKHATINDFLPYIRRNKYFKSQFDAFGIKFEWKPNKANFRICFPVDLVARILIFRVRMLPETFITPQPSKVNIQKGTWILYLETLVLMILLKIYTND